MNQDERIRAAMHEIVGEKLSLEADLWPQIVQRLVLREPEPKRASIKLSRKMVLLLVALLLMTTAAYAYGAGILDPGLKWAQEHGLLVTLNQPGKPTPYVVRPQSLAGVSAKLDWAYADENRIVFQVTLSGLTPPPGHTIPEMICEPSVSSDAQAHIQPYLINSENADYSPGEPLQLTYVAYQHIDALHHPVVKGTFKLILGACNNMRDQFENKTPVPFMGNFDMNFKIPVYKGRVISINQKIERAGVEMVLESATLSPSFADFTVCKRSDSQEVGWIDQVTLIVDNGEPQEMREIDYVDNNGQTCVSFGIGGAFDPTPKRMQLTIPRLTGMFPSDKFMDPAYQKAAQATLTQQGIEVEFKAWNDRYWQIIRKPAGMTDDQADQIVQGLLIHTLDGPWVFEVDQPVAGQ